MDEGKKGDVSEVFGIEIIAIFAASACQAENTHNEKGSYER